VKNKETDEEHINILNKITY